MTSMTKKYNVLMSEVHSVWYTVEAKNEEEAAEKALYGDCLEENDQGCEMGSQVICEIEEYEE